GPRLTAATSESPSTCPSTGAASSLATRCRSPSKSKLSYSNRKYLDDRSITDQRPAAGNDSGPPPERHKTGGKRDTERPACRWPYVITRDDPLMSAALVFRRLSKNNVLS